MVRSDTDPKSECHFGSGVLILLSMVEIIEHESRILQGNPLGDPTRRKIYMYLPPGYNRSQPYVTLLGLVGFTGTGGMLFNVDPLGEPLHEKLDRMIQSGACPPVVIAAPDCFNRFGGSQYINSSAIGNYEDYLMKEIVPSVSEKYKTKAWGVFGKSSGGYGSIVLGMDHPDVFQAFACHSGDAGFELCYLPDFPKALNAFQKAGGPAKWIDKVWNDVNHKRSEYHVSLNALAMSAHYSPNPKSPHVGVDFPFDLETGTFQEKVWERWKEWDPVVRIPKRLGNLKKLKGIYIDCGNRDEFGLHWGARAMHKLLLTNDIRHTYEEFDDGHMAITYRYDKSIPFLVKALS